VVTGLAATAVVLLIASALNWDLGLPTCSSAIAVTAIVTLKTRTNPLSLLREISWSTLALVAGLFIMVEAVETIGALGLTQRWLAWANAVPPSTGALTSGFAVGVANNLLNNLPLGLIVGSALGPVHVHGWLASAVLIGVDLGPNLSITGSLATILWLIALRREKVEVSFWSFLRIGVLAMPIALFCTIGGAIAMHWWFSTP